MNDRQLITILECCASDENTACCKKCALCEKYDCYSEISRNVLDLLSRQRAEINRWKYINKCDGQLINSLNKSYILAKSEAIKEFVHRLKDRVVQKCEYTDIRIFKEIDNLVKEMTEAEK